MTNQHLANDRGSITLETVIAVPVALLAVMLIINAALWYHARNTALAAAQEGVRTARAYGANPAQADATALAFARSNGEGFLQSPSVDTSGSTTTTIVVRVRGTAVSLVPGLHLEVNQVARGPVERFTTPSGNGVGGGR
ncbi:TadE family protein [Actinomadura sp. KC06]|uniref:TadE family protein n=1 Tax=Actinomadura sp. KC06 TaxID=2530369 RepID=UPI001FB7B859|nr:TadE family protein [Actinomadura sp. KC06]